MRQTWDEYFLGLAKYVGTRSKDRSTKVGAVAVGSKKEVRMTAYNGFPRMINDEIESRHERPIKYFYTSHAEENIICAAALVGVSLLGCTIYISSNPEPLPPCATCARMMIQAGIIRVVYEQAKNPNKESLKRWRDSSNVALEMLKEGSVEISVIEV